MSGSAVQSIEGYAGTGVNAKRKACTTKWTAAPAVHFFRLYKFFWGLGGTYPFHCGVLPPYLYTCWGNKRPSKINVVLNKGYTS